jgi:arylsulfatase A-like enzyme/Flp pilus assembly protein TadD
MTRRRQNPPTAARPPERAPTAQTFGLKALYAALAIGIAALALWRWAPKPAGTPTLPPRNVLLITIDTLRADALGAYGNDAAVTPLADRLALNGLRFDNAHGHSVVTLPSHASLLTGRLPIDHGIRDNAGFRLARTDETLATRLKAAGFRTGAFVSGFPLDSRFGLARGFDVYDDSFVDATPRPAFLEQERPGPETVAAAARWLRERTGDRWFCWIHLYEPHFPYAPPAPFATRFAANPYAGEAAAADAALTPVLEPILAAGASSDTLVVFTADHGESLGEHGEATHGVFAYEATLRVPLILHYPALLKPRAVKTGVSHVDVAPTVLQMLGMPAMAGARGHGLVDVARGRAPAEEAVYFEALSGSLNRGWAPLTGVISNGMKFIDLPIPELYDLNADPGETRNLATLRPSDVDTRRQLLRSFPSGEIRPTDESSEVRERLRALGYLSGRPGARNPPGSGEDPKHAIATESELQEITNRYVSGDRAGALAASRTLVAAHPDMRIALLQLSHLERDAGNLTDAIAPLRRALALHPGDAEAASLLGATLTTANRPAEAVQVLQPYAAAADADVQVLVALALAQARAGRHAVARATLDRALAGDPSNALLRVTAGTIELMAGRRPEARKAFESAIALNAGSARAHSSLGVLAAEEGHQDEAVAHWRRAVAIDPAEYGKLLAFGLSLARNGRNDAARPFVQLFADQAPAARYSAEVARAREWLGREQR